MSTWVSYRQLDLDQLFMQTYYIHTRAQRIRVTIYILESSNLMSMQYKHTSGHTITEVIMKYQSLHVLHLEQKKDITRFHFTVSSARQVEYGLVWPERSPPHHLLDSQNFGRLWCNNRVQPIGQCYGSVSLEGNMVLTTRMFNIV